MPSLEVSVLSGSTPPSPLLPFVPPRCINSRTVSSSSSSKTTKCCVAGEEKTRRKDGERHEARFHGTTLLYCCCSCYKCRKPARYFLSRLANGSTSLLRRRRSWQRRSSWRCGAVFSAFLCFVRHNHVCILLHPVDCVTMQNVRDMDVVTISSPATKILNYPFFSFLFIQFSSNHDIADYRAFADRSLHRVDFPRFPRREGQR